MWNKIKPYLISVAIAAGVGALSALLTIGSMDIYSELEMPPLAPPSILFPIVWTLLYILMGVSAALVYQKKSEMPRAVESALTVYGISLVFNFAWSIIFFRFRALFFAFIWLIALLALIIKTILSYKRISPLAAYLQIPYTVWVAFAGYLNLGIWLLNR